MRSNKSFQLVSDFVPQGDQPRAIEKICSDFRKGTQDHVLMGVTGSGKTLTMAHVVAQLNRPTLVMAPNKTLAAQLFQEFRSIFPQNAVEFFISYYDYYQPEAYVPSTDTYIAKDAAINDDIDKMRHAATRSLFQRSDVLIVASVSCIYGLGSPDSYETMVVQLQKGQKLTRTKLLKSLVNILYARNDANLLRGHFRVRGDIVDILPSHERDRAVRVQITDDKIASLETIDALTGQSVSSIEEVALYPNSHYVTNQRSMSDIIQEILRDLGVRLREYKAAGKFVEFQRLEQRVMHDVEMLEQLGWCSGIENYSRYLNGGAPGEAPPTLLDYFPKDFLLILDESHITVPQIRGMYRGDRSRKQVLVDFGFRLPAALDNRPLNFDEFRTKIHQTLYVSATPSPYELALCGEHYSEQVIRPTGLIDPEIQIRPARGQIDDLYGLIVETVAQKGRVLVTTLTKKMAEELTFHYQKLNLNVRYLHADIDSLDRAELLSNLRKGKFDILVGINLLREGLDLPEVKLVAVIDADKEGFLRSRSSLIQIVGRAARNSESRVIFYADSITDSMRQAIDETNRRRSIQMEYNTAHGIEPQTIIKKFPVGLRELYGITSPEAPNAKAEDVASLKKRYAIKSARDIEKLITQKSKQMQKAAGALEFEKAAELRDEVNALKQYLIEFSDDSDSSLREPDA